LSQGLSRLELLFYPSSFLPFNILNPSAKLP
jgi:hypothetical protein